MRIAIYVPICYTTNRKVTPIEKIQFFNSIAEDLTYLFNGLTVYANCFGTMLDKNNEIDYDQITTIEIFTTTKKFHEVQTEFHKLLIQIKRELRQDSVAYVQDNQIYFI